MKILLDLTLGVAGSGGLVTVGHGMALGLSRISGVQLSCAMASGYEDRAPSPSAVYSLDTGGIGGRVRSQLLSLGKLARRERPDWVLALNPMIPLFGPACAKYAVVVPDFRHRARPDEFSRPQRLYRAVSWDRALRRADLLIAISEQTAAEVRRFAPRRTSEVMVAPLGSDHVESWRRKRDDALGAFALHLAHRTNKGTELAIGAFARSSAAKRWRLKIVGVMESRRGAIWATVKRNGLESSVDLEARLDDAAFRRIFASSACLIFTSEYEGYGLPVLEAAQLGIPVVTTAVPASIEVCGVPSVCTCEPTYASVALGIDGVLRGMDMSANARSEARELTWDRTASVIYRALAALDEGS